MSEPQWITEKQVSQMTGIAEQTLRNHRTKRVGIPYYKFGGSVRYKKTDVIGSMESHKISFN